MPLKVALLENIFWTNGSYNKPATIPDSSKFQVIDVTPTMLSPFAGQVVITGDYNYCEFNDVLYFLSPIELKDQTKYKVKYLLTRDEWAFAVRNKTKVAGTVVKSLDEKLLWENIQLTQPVIFNPAKLNIVNLIEDEEYLTEVIEPTSLSFSNIYLAGRGVDNLINKPYSINFQGLNISFKSGWKNLIIPYIKNLINDIKDEKYMLTKVSQIESSFKFFWCLTPDDQAKRIGDIKEQDVYIEKIDFSKLSDIKPLSITNHFNPAIANTKIDIQEIGSSSIREYDLDLGIITLATYKGKLLVEEGYEKLTDKQLIKNGNDYYIVNKQEKTYLELINFPSNKEIWNKNLKTRGVEIERDLNLLDAKLRENKGYQLSSFYPATRNWIKSKSPNFRPTEDLNPPLPRNEDGTFDLEKFFSDYLSNVGTGQIETSITESPFAIGWWIYFPNTKPRPKFFYEFFGTSYKALFVETKDNIQALFGRITLQARSILKDPQIIKETIFNNWYKFIDETYIPPSENERLGKIYSIENEDLKTGMHLYDLIGTNYLLLIYKDTPHLIFQNAEIKAKGKRLSIKAQEQIPELDLFETINQSNFLQVFNKSFPLRDRITRNYEFNTEIKIITHPDSIGYDYAFIRHQGYQDNILESIEYPKSKLAAPAQVSAVEIENNYIAQQRNYEDLQLKRREASRRRSNEDLEWSFRWEEYGIKQANTLVTFALGLASVGFAGGLGGIAQVYAGLKGASKLISSTSSFISTGLEYRELTAAQQNQLQARLLENYSLELTHHRYDYDLKRNLKNMGNVAQAAAVTYRDVMNRYNLEIGANEIHLRIWTPTDLQMQTVNALYQETGVDCLISNVTIQIDENFSGIWRFSVIDAIDSNDGMNISYLNTLLQNGVRIVSNDVVFKQPIKTVQSFLLPEIVKQELDILRQKIENSKTVERVCKGLINYGDTHLIQEKEDEINELIKEQEDLKKISEEYFEQAKELKQEILDKQEYISKLKQSEKELIDNQEKLNQDIINLISAKDKCEQTYKQAQADLEQLNKVLSDLKEDQVKEKERYEEYIKEAKDDIRKLRKDYEYKAEQLKDMLKERNKFAEDIVAKNDEIEQYKKQIKELQNKLDTATDLAKQIEDQKKQIEEQAKQLAKQKADIEKQLEEERKKQAPDAKSIKQYEDQLAEIKAKEKEAQDKLNQLQEELKKHETTKEQLNKVNGCLILYKQTYINLHNLYSLACRYIDTTSQSLIDLAKGLSSVIIPGLVNNRLSYWQYQQYLWLHGNNLNKLFNNFITQWKELKIGTHLTYAVNDVNKKYINPSVWVRELDPNSLTWGWWIDPANRTKIDKNADTMQKNYKQYGTPSGVFKPYSAISWGNQAVYQDSWEKEEINLPLDPETLEKCADINIGDIISENIKETPEYKELNKVLNDLKEQLKVADIADIVKKLNEHDQLKEQLQQSQQAYTTCNNNLERYRKDYAELEQEKTQQQNLANLYKAESDKCKTEKTEALKARDDARAELLITKEYYKTNPLPDIPANAEAKKQGAIGVGVNFYNLLKNAHNLKYSIDAVIADYKNRTRSNKQNIANLGYYLNYLMDDVVRTMKPYIGEKETAFAYSKKIPNNRLQNIVQ